MQKQNRLLDIDLPSQRAKLAPAGLGFLLREAYRAFVRVFDVKLAKYDISHAQWVLLWFLWGAGSLTPLELSRKAGITKASATGVIESLRRRGLIHREPDAVDRRKVNIFLTRAGAALIKDLFACAVLTNTTAREGLSDAQIETLDTLLRNVTANLERAYDARHIGAT